MSHMSKNKKFELPWVGWILHIFLKTCWQLHVYIMQLNTKIVTCFHHDGSTTLSTVNTYLASILNFVIYRTLLSSCIIAWDYKMYNVAKNVDRWIHIIIMRGTQKYKPHARSRDVYWPYYSTYLQWGRNIITYESYKLWYIYNYTFIKFVLATIISSTVLYVHADNFMNTYLQTWPHVPYAQQ